MTKVCCEVIDTVDRILIGIWLVSFLIVSYVAYEVINDPYAIAALAYVLGGYS